MVLALSLIGVAVSIGVGWKLKINTGIIAMIFAFLIGTLGSFETVNDAGETVMAPLTATNIIGYFPVTIVFYLIAVSLFFGFANETGTMALLGKKLIRVMGKKVFLLAPAAVIASCIMGLLGVGASTVVILGPLMYPMFIAAELNPLLCAICLGFGTNMGGSNPIAGFSGVISKTLIAQNVGDDAALLVGMNVWIHFIVMLVIFIALSYFFFKGWKAGNVQNDIEDAPFDARQKKMLVLIAIAFVAIVVPTILAANIKDVPFITALGRVCQPQIVFIAMSVVCALMKIADERTVIAKVPWGTIIMIAGMCMLIQVAIKGGLATTMANVLAGSFPVFLIPGVMLLIAAFLSFFSSATSVVYPLIYSIIPETATMSGLSATTLYGATFAGGLSTSLSPFALGGAVQIAGCPDDEAKEYLSKMLIPLTFIFPIIGFLLACVGLFGIGV